MMMAFTAFAAAAGMALTPELHLQTRSVTAVALAPDGREALYCLQRPRRPDEGAGRAIDELWVIDLSSDASTRIAEPSSGCAAPSYSATGRYRSWIAVDASSGAEAQIFIQQRAGAARALQGTRGALRFAWSPDDTRIAYSAEDEPNPEEARTIAAGRDAIVDLQFQRPSRLRVLSLDQETVSPLTPADMSVLEFAWSHDGERIVFTAAPSAGLDDELLHARLYVSPVAKPAPKVLTHTFLSPLAQPQFSPDGRWISWLGGTSDGDPVAGGIFLANAQGTRVRKLAPRFSFTPSGLYWLRGEPARLVASVVERQQTLLYELDLSSGDARRMPGLEEITFGTPPSFSRDGRTITLAGSRAGRPVEFFAGRVGATVLARTRLNPQLEHAAPVSQETFSWRSPDGLHIEGVLTKPLGFRADRRYPAVLQIHGGPESACLSRWPRAGVTEAWVHMIAARGVMVLCPNYRGSIGRGTEFHRANEGAPMGASYADMTSGLNRLVELGIADPRRLGIAGSSWGGLAAAWGATFDSGRFRAAVVMAGVSNWVSLAGSSRSALHEQLAHWGAPLHAGNFQRYLEQSPIYHAASANTPTLILHGAADSDVPMTQALELFAALRTRPAARQLVIYPREGHAISEEAHQLDALQRTLEWIERYLLDSDTNREAR